MGFIQAYSACAACHRLFTYNPVRVPSVRINGHREPICEACLTIANARRAAAGVAPIVPLPGAYEAADECEIPWGED